MRIGGQVTCLDYVHAPKFGVIHTPHACGLLQVEEFDTSQIKLAAAARKLTTASIEVRWAQGSSVSYIRAGDGLAVLQVWGFIGPASLLGAACLIEDLGATLQAVRRDETVQAIVLLIDSPGGVFEGVSTIVDLIREIDNEKPVFSYIERYALGSAFLIAGAARCVAANSGAKIGAVRPTHFEYIEDSASLGFAGALATFIPDSMRCYPDALIPDKIKPSYDAVWSAAALVMSNLGIRQNFHADDERPLIVETIDAEQAHKLGVVHSISSASATARAALSSVGFAPNAAVRSPEFDAALAKQIQSEQIRIARSTEARENPEAALEALAAGVSFEEFILSLSTQAPEDGAATILQFQARRQSRSPDESEGPEAA